jgi:hypothetical protein
VILDLLQAEVLDVEQFVEEENPVVALFSLAEY